ncbi:MAG: hypothetical protein OHK0013_41910 [Sandaracinaceae bacterium]
MSTTLVRSVLALGVATIATTAAPATAQWTLPQGRLVVSSGADYQYANTEFFGFADGPGGRTFDGERPFPLRGRYVGGNLRFGVRAGLTDQLEVELGIPLTIVSFQGDPVLLLPQPADSTEDSIDYYQRNIINLNQTNGGIGDIHFAVRYRWLLEPIVVATEVRLKVPGGYQTPAGTFGERPTSRQDFVENAATYVAPANVRDDITLGDGQLDLTARLLLGMSFDTGTFVRVEGGYNVRFDAGHQVLAALRAGQFVADWLLLYAGVGLAYTVTPGRIIGVSVAAEDPLLPADRYLGVDNLFLREVRLQRDVLDVQGGAIFRITPEAELNVGYGRIVWGRNTAAVNSVFMSISVRTDLGRPAEPEPLSEPEPVAVEAEGAQTPVPPPPTPTGQGEVAAQAGNTQQTQTPTSPRVP